MAVTRLGQIAAEMVCKEEFITRQLGDPTLSNTQAYSGNYSVYSNSNSDSIGIGFSARQAVRVACFIHFPITTPYFNDANILYFSCPNESDSVVFGIVGNLSTGTLSFIADGVQIDSSLNTNLETGVWHHYSMVVDCANGIFKAWIDSESVLNYNNGGAFSNSSISGAWSCGAGIFLPFAYVDNLYADEVTGADIHEAPPRKFFMFKSVSGPGTYSDWAVVNESANYKAIDEPTAHNSDTDYNKSLSGSLTDTFSTTPVSIPSDTNETVYIVRAVIPQAIVKRNNVAQDAQLRMIAYDGLNLGYGDTENYIGPGYELFWHRYTTQPDGERWNETDINNMEYGYQSQGTFT